jgi:hypothetical protein
VKKLHREMLLKNSGAGASGWMWCLHCQRAYLYGCYREGEKFSYDEVFVREVMSCGGSEAIAMLDDYMQLCPYPDCDGDAVMDSQPWEWVRGNHPEYPEVPIAGVEYPLY